MVAIGIETIYDAAFDREHFPVLIERLVRAFGAQCGFIGWTDADRGVGFQAQYGNDPQWLQSYVDTYMAHDILQPVLLATPEGVCALAYPHLQKPEIRESIFYREYLAPQAIIDNLAVNLIKRPGLNAHLALIRKTPAEPFAPEECDRLSALLPHLRRAMFIQSNLVRAADHAASIHAFAGANSHALLLGADRCVVEIDQPLARWLRLRPGDSLGDGALGRAIASSIQSGQPVATELPDETAPVRILCEARTLAPNRFGDLAASPAPTHAVHITMLDQPRLIAFDAMGDLYRLTPTELKVLRNAIEHGDLTGIGDRLGMARATTRTHLHRIYEKTQTRSFADLANLAHRFGQLMPEAGEDMAPA